MRKTRKAVLIFLWLVLLYSFLRLVFFLLYFSKNDFSATEMATVIYWGCRMDISGIFYLNLGFFIYYFLLQDLLPARRKKAGDRIITIRHKPSFAGC